MYFEQFNFDITGIPVLLCGVLVLVISIIKTIKIFRSDNPKDIGLIGVWLMGLLSFLFGLLEQMIMIRDMYLAISRTGDISATILANGLSNTTDYPIGGLSILIISLFLWGILKGLITIRAR